MSSTVLTSREEEPSAEPSGHVTSISVLRPYRRLGLANKLMKQSRGLLLAIGSNPSEEAMVAHYNASFITLHVRKSNRAAISLYRDTLGFEVHVMEKGYCELGCVVVLTVDADGEDAYGMRFIFPKKGEAAA